MAGDITADVVVGIGTSVSMWFVGMIESDYPPTPTGSTRVVFDFCS